MPFVTNKRLITFQLEEQKTGSIPIENLFQHLSDNNLVERGLSVENILPWLYRPEWYPEEYVNYVLLLWKDFRKEANGKILVPCISQDWGDRRRGWIHHYSTGGVVNEYHLTILVEDVVSEG
jgi:hypothetical protein